MSDQASLIYLHIKGSKQGVFKTDDGRAGRDKCVCLAFGHRVHVPHDTQGKGGRTVARNHPVWVICEWRPLVAQCLQAAWRSEPLSEVGIERVLRDSKGDEHAYLTYKLRGATIAYFRHLSGNTARWLPGEHRDLVRIGFRAEKMDVSHKGDDGDTTASYDRKEGK